MSQKPKTTKSKSVDPYDLLRQAEEIIRNSFPQSTDGPRERWLKEYKNVPGASLSKRAVQVLRDPHRLLRDNGTKDIIEMLIAKGYLRIVFTHAGRSKQTRRTRKGSEALRLRKDVP